MTVRHLHDPLKRSETFPIYMYFFWVIYAAEVPTTPLELGDSLFLSLGTQNSEIHPRSGAIWATWLLLSNTKNIQNCQTSHWSFSGLWCRSDLILGQVLWFLCRFGLLVPVGPPLNDLGPPNQPEVGGNRGNPVIATSAQPRPLLLGNTKNVQNFKITVLRTLWYFGDNFYTIHRVFSKLFRLGICLGTTQHFWTTRPFESQCKSRKSTDQGLRWAIRCSWEIPKKFKTSR